jgi:hypothetical protein
MKSFITSSGFPRYTFAALLPLLVGMVMLLLAVQAVQAQTYTMGTSPAINGATITTCSGTFTDSGGASSNYGTNEDITVTFCSSTGQPLTLSFENFATGSGDFVYVYDGPSTSSPQFSGSPFSGNNFSAGPKVKTSTGTCITVRFTSNATSSIADFGWRAQIFCATAITFNDCAGIFYDPGGVIGNTPHLNSTITTICSDLGGQIRTAFSSFSLDQNFDFLYVYNGPDRSSPQVTGSPFSATSPGTITGTGTCLTFHFISDGSFDAAGWAATISCVNPCAISAVSATPTCAGSTYTLNGAVTFANPPTSGTLTVAIAGGGSHVLNGPFTSPVNYSITGQTADGAPHTVSATFSASPDCNYTANFSAPTCSAPCSLTSAGETLETCNNFSTMAVATDDYITFSLNPTGTNLGATYTVSADNGGTVTPSGGTYGAATAFQLQNGSANGTLYTITITDVSGGTCTVTTTVQQNACSTPPCSLTSAGETLETCNDNSTSATGADDYITFSLNPTGTGLGATYSVTASGGAAVTLAGGGAATGISYGSATALRLQNGSANGTSYTITVTDVSGGTCTVTTTVQQNACSALSCTSPSANFVPIPATCVNLVPQDNGRIVLTAFSNTDRFGVSTGNTYTGPAYAGAGAITGINQNVQTGIPNVGGGTYTVRVFNGNNTCFTDYVITVPPAFPCKIDPTGYIYCEETGQIITGGTITVTPPPGGSYVITQNGSTGLYQFFSDAFVSGVYTITYTPPAGYMLSTSRLPSPTLDPTGQPNPYIVGSTSTNGTFLDDFTAATNPYYFSFDLANGDPDVFNNNIPLKGCCAPPVLTVTPNGMVCSGGSIDLATLVTSAGGGTLSYYTTLANANAGTSALPSSTVTPASATNYYVRSQTSAGCYTVKEVTVALKAPVCGVITVMGPN